MQIGNVVAGDCGKLIHGWLNFGLGLKAVDDGFVAKGGEVFGNALPDARCAAGDQNHLVLKFAHNSLSLFLATLAWVGVDRKQMGSVLTLHWVVKGRYFDKEANMAIAFGTSGLRGPAEDFTSQAVGAYVGAFLSEIAGDGPHEVYVGADLRESSPRISGLVLAAIKASGFSPVYGGNVPTPALAGFAMARNCPAIMVTGSHIPESYNGIKFYRRDSELLKRDEPVMRAKAEALLAEGASVAAVELPAADVTVARDYVTRFVDAFGPGALQGLRLGVDLHSAVGRDLLLEIFEGLGAICFPYRRSDKFIAVDTEAVDPKDIARATDEIAQHKLDAVVSTDGDGDRPLLIGADGTQINGDVLGVLTARALGIETVVTPLSSTSAIEMSGWFRTVTRTKIGSPYVVAAMAAAGGLVAGFEANGGFLLGSDLVLGNGTLSALPTRDAVLPLVVTLMAAKASGGLSALVAELPRRVMLADRLKQVAAEDGAAFLKSMQGSSEARALVHAALADVVDINEMDGVRLTLGNGNIVHFRQSGNAPELRCYIETAGAGATKALLAEMMVGMAKALGR